MDVHDTIVALSSTNVGVRTVVRITGPGAVAACEQSFRPFAEPTGGCIFGQVAIDDGLWIDAQLYLFIGPHSYTGQTVAEFHVTAARPAVQALVQTLLAMGLRPAGPGEFTARAYLNGKLDLAQAEAVNEIVVCSNRFQLSAAERLLAGSLAKATARIQTELLDCLSLIEASLDFSTEPIEFISARDAIRRLSAVRGRLQRLLDDAIRCEALIEMPSVGIAGAPNAGKSSLVNALLGRKRSIVSDAGKTTRDVLTGILKLEHADCVLFDCPGLLTHPVGILDELAQQAAVEALDNSQLVIFCVDISKDDWYEDLAVFECIKRAQIIPAAAKCDRLADAQLDLRLTGLEALFQLPFVPISSQVRGGLDRLRNEMDAKLRAPGRQDSPLPETARDTVTLTARHRQAVTSAIGDLDQALIHMGGGDDELAAMMLRSAKQAISTIEQEPIDEQILDRIFGSFCVGK